MTESKQIKALKERIEHWQHKFDELASENDRLRAELDLMNDTLTGNFKQIADRDRTIAEKDLEIERLKAACHACGTKAGEIKMQLSEAKKRIEELEDAVRWALGETDFRLHNNGEGPYWWRNELRQRANIKPQ